MVSRQLHRILAVLLTVTILTTSIAPAQILPPAYAEVTAAVHSVPSYQQNTVAITNAGFRPSQITITAGQSVTWVNQTQSTYVLKDGNAPSTCGVTNRLYLPLVAKQQAGAAQASQDTTNGTVGDAGQTGQVNFSETLGPGESFTFRYASAGTYRFHVENSCDFAGTVTVRSVPAVTPTSTPLPPVADQEGPVLNIASPKDGQSVYQRNPRVQVRYGDRSGVEPSSVQITLNGANVTPGFSVTATGAEGTISVAENAVHKLVVTVKDKAGNTGTAQSEFYVPANPGSITPPAAPDNAGYVSGTVYDASSCTSDLADCRGLAGVFITVEAINGALLQQVRAARQAQLHKDQPLEPLSEQAAHSFTAAVNGTVVTGPNGFFAFPVSASGTYWLRAERSGFTYGQREVFIVERRSTATNDIYLKPLDAEVSDCGPAGCVHTNSDNSLQLDIPAGAIPDGITHQVSATNFEQVEFLPSGDLPAGTGETYAFNLGGSSEITFTKPITIRQANDRGFRPGTKIPLGYWNQTLQAWEHAGTGVVDASGQWIVIQVTHFSNYDCNDPVTPGSPNAGSPGSPGSPGGPGNPGNNGGPGSPNDPGLGSPGGPAPAPSGEDPNAPGEPNPDEPDECPGCTIYISSGLLEEEITLPP